MRPHRVALGMALAFLAAHLGITLLLRSSGLLSNLLILGLTLASALACFRQCNRCSGFVRTKWRLLGIGILFWAFGQAILTYVDSIAHLPQDTALASDFYFFLWGVPVLLAIASADDDGNSASFLVLDSIQALMAVALTYIQLFAGKSVSSPEALGSAAMVYLYAGENFVLAGAASLRLLARPWRQERHFYRVLCLFLWTYALISIPGNYTGAILNLPTGTPYDLVWDLPFLALLLCLGPRERIRTPHPPVQTEHQTLTALVIYNACPAIFTIAVLILAAHIVRQHLYLGIAAMTVTLFTYTLRAALLQTRYVRSQQALVTSERALREANDRLQEISYADPLTGIANRRRFEQVLEVEWNRALRSNVPISLLMIDVDHFKQINDQYGHVYGDACLVAMAQSLAGHLRRGGELLARYGGEEFIAILPNVNEEGALEMAETMRLAASQVSPPFSSPEPPRAMTVSVGICSMLPAAECTAAQMVASADEAMYRAKRRGRNRTQTSRLLNLVDEMAPMLQ